MQAHCPDHSTHPRNVFHIWQDGRQRRCHVNAPLHESISLKSLTSGLLRDFARKKERERGRGVATGGLARPMPTHFIYMYFLEYRLVQKIITRQAYNALRCNVFWACRVAIFSKCFPHNNIKDSQAYPVVKSWLRHWREEGGEGERSAVRNTGLFLCI